MGTAANLRQHFRTATGMSPAAYRRRYARAEFDQDVA
jgi:transcriptional regulator GlxA family with amidase domain